MSDDRLITTAPLSKRSLPSLSRTSSPVLISDALRHHRVVMSWPGNTGETSVRFLSTVFEKSLANPASYNQWRSRERALEEHYKRSRNREHKASDAQPRSVLSRRSASMRGGRHLRVLRHYPPSLDTLADYNKKLQTHWKGHKLDLSEDVDRQLLHPDELEIASILRLSCRTYLLSKRRIFQARVSALRANRPFLKTDAQKACNIDVNKASRLWEAYHDVNWFDGRYLEECAQAR